MKRLFVVPILLLASLPLLYAFPQVKEAAGAVDQTAVTVGRGRPISEGVTIGPNQVLHEARHCQAFMKDGKLSDEGADLCAKDQRTLFYSTVSHNLETTAGRDAIASQIGQRAAQVAACGWMAVTADATAPAIGDTTLTSEITLNGLGRAVATFAHTGGAATFTEVTVYTATGTQASQKSGLFNAISTGTLCFENTYTTVTLNSGDTLTITWTITVS